MIKTSVIYSSLYNSVHYPHLPLHPIIYIASMESFLHEHSHVSPSEAGADTPAK